MVERSDLGDGYYRYQCQACGWEVPSCRLANLRNECFCRQPQQDYEAILRTIVRHPPGVAPGPSLVRKAANFTRAAVRHQRAGRPEASDETVSQRFAVCQACALYQPQSEVQGTCTHQSCGCALKAVGLAGRNKLRWADQACPIGRWGAVADLCGE
ncbi:MAG: hypothetical protein IT424_06445 [Pirellulales bacterium]|nr:hypothetical protein [Pirellulales bacterium]